MNIPRVGVFIVLLALWLSPPAAGQQLLDRIVARVGGVAITQTDVEAALELGVLDAMGPDRVASGTQQMIDRQLMLAEVARFPPAEPSEQAVVDLVARMKARAGGGFEALARRTGLDERRVRELARDTLRIQAYVDQRFGTVAQITPADARAYYDSHRQEFTRNGQVRPFDEVEAEAREAAAAERRRRMMTQWVEELRTRGEIVVPTSRP